MELDGNLPSNVDGESIPVGQFSKHWWTIGLSAYLRRQSFDLFHGTNYEVPLWSPCPTVITIHDLSLLLHSDKQEKRRGTRARRRLPLMARIATAIIVPTQAIKREVCETLRVTSEKVFVVAEAARTSFRHDKSQALEIKTRFGIKNRFVLAVGTIEPRKNYSALIKAFERALAKNPNLDLQLVIAGAEGWRSGDVLHQIEQSSSRDRIVLTGYLTDEYLRALYSTCSVFVYPSTYEGFGLPPLEAMSCGAPVIASAIPAVAEVTARAARLVPPTSEDDLAHAIVEVETNEDLRLRLVDAGIKRAAEFSWERTAAATREVYRQVISSRRVSTDYTDYTD
jgi:glycosyltransferase involved in cell wall biosynthesis